MLALVAQQIQEMQMVREKVYAMEQSHLALKQKSVASPSWYCASTNYSF